MSDILICIQAKLLAQCLIIFRGVCASTVPNYISSGDNGASHEIMFAHDGSLHLIIYIWGGRLVSCTDALLL